MQHLLVYQTTIAFFFVLTLTFWCFSSVWKPLKMHCWVLVVAIECFQDSWQKEAEWSDVSSKIQSPKRSNDLDAKSDANGKENRSHTGFSFGDPLVLYAGLRIWTKVGDWQRGRNMSRFCTLQWSDFAPPYLVSWSKFQKSQTGSSQESFPLQHTSISASGGHFSRSSCTVAGACCDCTKLF